MTADNVVALRPAAQRQPELESRILGALMDLEDPRGLIASSGLTAEHFGSPKTRSVWQICSHLATKRRLVNSVTVFTGGLAAKILSDSDADWLAQLQASNTMTAPTFTQACSDLRDLVSRKATVSKLEAILRGLQEGASPASTRAGLNAVIQQMLAESAGDETGASDLMGLTVDWDSNNRNNRVSYMPTHVRPLDDVIGGWPANLTLLAGQPGVGKSAVLASIIEAQLMADREVRLGLFGLEDGTQWVVRRLVAKAMRMKLREVGNRKLTGQEQDELATVGERLYPMLERLVTFRFGRVKASDIVHRAHNWVRRGVRCIYIDHIGEVDHSSAASKWQKEHEGVAETVRVLRDFAVEVQVPVVALAHLARSDDKRGNTERPPVMQDLAGSAFLERRARLILGLWHKGGAGGALRATVLKATEGKPGDTIEFQRHFEAALVDHQEGGTVNLNAEASEERKAKAKERLRESVAASLERNKVKAELAPKPEDVATAPADPNQPSLFEEPKP